MDERSYFNKIIFDLFKPLIHPRQGEFPRQEFEDEIEERPNTDEPSRKDSVPSPRDLLLKGNNKSNEKENYMYQAPPHHSKIDIFTHPSDDGNSDDGFFSDSFHYEFQSLFDTMEKLMKSKMFNFGPFDFPNFPSHPNGPSFDAITPNLERKDTDLDGSSGNEIASLLKEPPSYEQKATAPQSQARFHSTSIVRIRRPDGVIEETKKYRDSTGREEVEVTTREPGFEGGEAEDGFAENPFKSFFGKLF